MHHPTDRITHTTAFVTPVVEHSLEREIAQWVHPMKDRSDDPSHHERTLYLWATSRSWVIVSRCSHLWYPIAGDYHALVILHKNLVYITEQDTLVSGCLMRNRSRGHPWGHLNCTLCVLIAWLRLYTASAILHLFTVAYVYWLTDWLGLQNSRQFPRHSVSFHAPHIHPPRKWNVWIRYWVAYVYWLIDWGFTPH